MKKILPVLKESAGFTLIELLIVIAILGVLATAVLSAINPVEQINRGRDTGSQSDAEQLLGGIARFHAAQGYLPWQTNSSDPSTTGWTKVANAAVAPGGWVVQDVLANGNVLEKLGSGTAGTQELQNSYVNRIIATNYNPLYVYNDGGTGSSTYVCFKPASSSFFKQARKRWNGGTDCTGVACACTGLPTDLAGASANVCDSTADGPAVKFCLP